MNKKNNRIYIIEDDQLTAEAMKSILVDDELYFDVSIFLDAFHGFQSTVDSPPDLVLLDLMMPHLRGEEIMMRLKQQQIATRVVVVTAIFSVEKVVEMIKTGACDYIVKPFSRLDLIRVIQRALVLDDTLDSDSKSDLLAHLKKPLNPNKRELQYTFYEYIVTHFSESEIQTLCFKLDIDHEIFLKEGKNIKAQEVIRYCIRHGRIVELAAQCSLLRPKIDAFSNFESAFKNIMD